MRKYVVNELRATDPALARAVHGVDVRGFVKDDAVISRVLVFERELLPRLGHFDWY
jgi:hypothetical protein